MIGLTKLGVIFIALMGFFYAAALTAQSGLLLLLIGIFAGCYLVSLVAAWNVVRRVVVVAPPTIQLAERERLAEPWKVINGSAFSTGFFTLEAKGTPLFKVRGLEKGQSGHVLPDLCFTRRGVYSNKNLKLVSVYPFGLVRIARSCSVGGEVVVVPALYVVEAPEACGLDTMVGGKMKGRHVSASGVYFSGVRPLRPGDSMRHIHWRSSSKGQGMMVKSFEEELSGRLAFLMDPGSQFSELADSCIRATGSLMFSSLDAGHHVEWMRMDAQTPLLIPPFADGGDILNRLARVESNLSSITSLMIQEAVERVSRKSSLNFVMTRYDHHIEQALARLREAGRTISLFLPEALVPHCRLGGIHLYEYRSDEIKLIHEKRA